MVLSIAKKIVMFVPNKLVAINQNIDKVISLPESTSKTFTYVTKVTGTTAGEVGAAKWSVDFDEAIACKDGICATVLAISVEADSLQICASFIPGPNVTSIVTTPISVSCKVFVWCCKKYKLPWGSC